MEQPKTVLIVEDEKNIVDILRFNLQREGYQTAEAYDGEEGLEKARTADPDLILLDVMLPKMNGFDVCRQLREAGSSVPVIILTAREEEADKVFGLEIGADDYITSLFHAGTAGPGLSQYSPDRYGGSSCGGCLFQRYARSRRPLHQYGQSPGIPCRAGHRPDPAGI